jgi:hypothetical protein
MTKLQSSLPETSSETERTHQPDSVVWAIFFIWIGFSMLAVVPWGWFLIGVGALIGAAQVARKQIGMAIDGFWTACGAVIFAAGLWDLLQLPLPLAPVLLIGLGVVLLVKTFARTDRAV